MSNIQSFFRILQCALVVVISVSITAQSQTVPQKKVLPFALNQVTLLPGPFKDAMDRKCNYLLFLDNKLSALAQAYQSTGDARYKAKADSLVNELQKCQNAAVSAGFGAGYLAAIPESYVNTLLSLGNIWAPLYNIIHKTFAGLLDCYRLLKNTTEEE